MRNWSIYQTGSQQETDYMAKSIESEFLKRQFVNVMVGCKETSKGCTAA